VTTVRQAAYRPTTANLVRRSSLAYSSAVPVRWRSAVPIKRLTIIGGYSSLSYSSGLTKVAAYHANGDYTRLRSVMAHEWGHQLSWKYGTRAYNGAPPAGFPQRTRATQETWADCVSWALIGRQYPYGNVPKCSRAAMVWTKRWLAAGPNGHRRTAA
jgi:hypothetical protein